MNKHHSLNSIFRFNDEIMEELNIPKIKLIDDNEEIWKYVYFDKHKEYNKLRRFMVSSYGRVYDFKKRKLLNSYGSIKSSKGYYKAINFYFSKDDEKNYFIHRLVALAFLPINKDKPFVNHKDGNPEHNYVWNLEWCTPSENYIHALKTGLKKEPLGENRSNAKWTDNEIHLICSLMEKGHKATYIYKILGDLLKDPKVQYERVRTLYKHIIHQTHWRHISCQYNIDFTKYNYSKEKSSVAKAQLREKEIILE